MTAEAPERAQIVVPPHVSPAWLHSHGTVTPPERVAPLDPERWLSVADYAALLGVGTDTVADAVTARRIHFHRVGRHVRFSPADRLANEGEWSPTPPAKTPVRRKAAA